MADLVALVHPDTGHVIRCTDRAARVHRKAGWIDAAPDDPEPEITTLGEPEPRFAPSPDPFHAPDGAHTEEH